MPRKNRENQLIIFLKTQAYFMKLIYKEHPKSIIIFILLSIVISATPPALIFLNKNIIDTISILTDQPQKYDLAIMLLILLFGIQFFSSLLENFLEFIFFKITQSVSIVLQKLINNKLVKMPLEEYEDNQFFDNINLANIAIRGNGIQIVNNSISIIGNLISLISIIGILISIHWTMPLALFLSTIPGVVLIFIAKTKKYQMNKDTTPTERELAFTNGLFMNKSSIKEIKIYSLGNFLIEKWLKLSNDIRKSKLKFVLWETKTKSIAVFILQFSSFCVSLLLVSQIQTNHLSIGSYVALLGAVTAVQGIFGSIGGSLGSIFETAVYNKALMKILNYKSRSYNSQNNELLNIDQINMITLNNVSFVYPKTTFAVLKDISLNIKKGEKISIVGSNGSGKSTLVNCIIGLYDVCSGEVIINGVNVNRINREKLFDNISTVFQDFSKYKYSIRENIGFGDLSHIDDSKKLYNVLEKVGLEDKIHKFPKGLDTYLTKEFYGGTELSGGEWQRVALARAFLKDADFIILDEPTAALDPVTELNIFNLFNKLSTDKTTITISHRIGPTKYSDRIIVMDKGEIIEQGNFEYLIDKKGYYYEMYQSQIQLYENKSDSFGDESLCDLTK